MVIDKTSWHARLYAWWYAKKHNWSGEPTTFHTNLCPYVRAVLFWAPLRFLFRTKVGYVTWTALALSAEYGLWRLGGWVPFQVQGTILFLALVVAGVIATGIGVKKAGGVVGQTAPAQSVKSFGRVLYKYGHSVHKGICPFIEIK